jgi:hypothetical protein
VPVEDVAKTGHAALAADALHLDRLMDGGHAYWALTPWTGLPAAIHA